MSGERKERKERDLVMGVVSPSCYVGFDYNAHFCAAVIGGEGGRRIVRDDVVLVDISTRRSIRNRFVRKVNTEDEDIGLTIHLALQRRKRGGFCKGLIPVRRITTLCRYTTRKGTS
ncbi:hypothetical protein R1flu_015716 [Riccia fluitans]|uniref:Uncharacterized protein n=1 Tax=Riccia fluitans TaxID=41844 RepID=A0ABD1YKL9_9MARC